MIKIIAAAFAATLLLADFAAAQGMKIGFVSIARIQRESVQAQRANEAMKRRW